MIYTLKIIDLVRIINTEPFQNHILVWRSHLQTLTQGPVVNLKVGWSYLPAEDEKSFVQLFPEPGLFQPLHNNAQKAIQLQLLA